jgi:transposase-like protein
MKNAPHTPSTLQEAIIYFADVQVNHDFLTQLRWPNGVTCPRCECDDTSYISTRRIWKCKGCKRQFSVKVGTIFEDSPLGLDKWLPALWMLANCKNGISSYELSRALGVTQKTAWFMLSRIRLAMQTKSFTRLDGEVEIDETFIGGRAKFMHKAKKDRVITGTGGSGKTAVMGMLQRKRGAKGHSKVKAAVVPNVRRGHLDARVRESVKPGAAVYTDALPSYNKLHDAYAHEVINHAERYVDGRVHTNGLENFWSLLKRSVKGTYVSVDPFHLFRYLDEQTFRFNERGKTDAERFLNVASDIIGKRLTYKALIGADMPPATT